MCNIENEYCHFIAKLNIKGLLKKLTFLLGKELKLAICVTKELST